MPVSNRDVEIRFDGLTFETLSPRPRRWKLDVLVDSSWNVAGVSLLTRGGSSTMVWLSCSAGSVEVARFVISRDFEIWSFSAHFAGCRRIGSILRNRT